MDLGRAFPVDQPQLRVPVREPLAAAAAAAPSAGVHPRRGQYRDHAVLRRASLHLHVGVRAHAGRPPVVRRLPPGSSRPRLRARPGQDRPVGPDLRRRHRRPRARRGPAGRGMALLQGAQAADGNNQPAGVHVAGLAARPADDRPEAVLRTQLRRPAGRRVCGGRQPRHGGGPAARDVRRARRLRTAHRPVRDRSQHARADDPEYRVVRVRGDAGAASARCGGGRMTDTGGLLAAIRDHRADFEAAGDQAEDLRTLPGDAVDALRGMGAFWLKTPAELGGTPLDPVDFCDVIEELAYADSSTAWAAMIGAGCAGLAGGWLPEAGARRVFAPDSPLPVVAGQLQPRGTGRPVEGGYVVSGRWSFASGIMHASWLIGAFHPQPAADAAVDDSQRIVIFVLPKDQAEVIANWQVAGLVGTGSMDFRVAEQFVPDEMTYDLGIAAVRGGDLFRLGMPA